MIAALVLAAGASTRMGQPKALLRTDSGERFAERIAATARQGGCGEAVLVVGPPHGEAIRGALPPGWATVWNSQPERGMLSSVQAGVASLPASVTAALVWPVDMPFVDAATVRAVVDAMPGHIALPTHDGRGGHPLRIPRALFAEVMALDPASGLKALLGAHAAEIQRLPVGDRNVLVDVDTPDDYARTRA